MTWIDAIGWLAAALTLAAYSMRTMLPLRISAIGANLSFIVYGAMTEVYPMLVLHLCLLPLNTARLVQIRRDRKRAAQSTRDDALGALRPFMRPMSFEDGTLLFRKGDPADRVYLIESGAVCLEELGISLGPGDVLGEIAFFTDARTRMASARCTRKCRLLAADQGSFIHAYYQDPALGLYITRLIATRLYDGASPRPGPHERAEPAPVHNHLQKQE